MSDSGTEAFYARFWGVRGSIPCPGPEFVRYGGNTSCVEIRCGQRLLVFDAGSGLYRLGETLTSDVTQQVDIFLSHVHYDHIIGLPFFSPAYLPTARLDIWAAQYGDGLQRRLSSFMQPPFFPVPLADLAATINFHDFLAGDNLAPHSGIRIRTAALNHPDAATGYRIDYQGKSICYVTDTEHFEAGPDQRILDLIQKADLLIYDATFTDEEYPQFRNWGHSTWQEGVKLCELANVGRLAAFHHAPEHDDQFLDTMASDMAKVRPGSEVAQEGMTLYP